MDQSESWKWYGFGNTGETSSINSVTSNQESVITACPQMRGGRRRTRARARATKLREGLRWKMLHNSSHYDSKVFHTYTSQALVQTFSWPEPHMCSNFTVFLQLNLCVSADERGAAKDTCKGEDDQAACGAASGNQGLGCRVCGLRVGL